MTKRQIKEFLERLEGKEGCNFRKNKDGETCWNCDSIHYSWKLSRKILKKMKIPWEEQIYFLNECADHGGYCDCEILFNAADKL